MNSLSEVNLPPARSPTLILAHPTASERRSIWTQSHLKWGGALVLDEYLHREEYLMTVPLAKGGGITHWILTVDGMDPADRPILSSCETLRKRALVAAKNGESVTVAYDKVVNGSKGNGSRNKEKADTTGEGKKVEEVIAHCIGSVFTDPQFRGRGYASRMMELVGERLRSYQGALGSVQGCWHHQTLTPPLASISVLFSDIGKKFYAARGWAAFPSTHLSFTPQATAAPKKSQSVKPIDYYELAELCALDERLLRDEMAERLDCGNRTCVALAPDLDAFLWHLMREDFMTKRILGHTPRIRGAVFGAAGSRIWTIWTRSYLSKPPKADGNTLYILRFVVENESADAMYLSEGVQAVISAARNEAYKWKSGHVELWNPSQYLLDLIRQTGLEYEAVEREMESIPSLQWYGAGRSEDVEWIANEKYAWY